MSFPLTSSVNNRTVSSMDSLDADPKSNRNRTPSCFFRRLHWPNTVSFILGKIDYTLIFYNGNAKKDTLVVSTSY